MPASLACVLALACTRPNPAFDEPFADASESTFVAEGDGEGEPSSGDGDGDPSASTGDGDGESPTGDGDGEPPTGDGDGEPPTGDGDGDSGDGDGDGEPEPTCESPPEDMTCIPGGLAELGCVFDEPPCENDELPVHQVELSTFLLDIREVTVEDYSDCVEDGFCSAPGLAPACTWELDQPELPINCVSWVQAYTYCNYLGKSLPTSAQWERAAGGPFHDPYPWGLDDVSCERAIVTNCDVEYPQPAGSAPFGTSPEGALDLIGNVAEWVADWYDPEYYADSPLVDPEGPDVGTSKVARGGSWKTSFESDLQSWDRGAIALPAAQSTRYGFRCALNL